MESKEMSERARSAKTFSFDGWTCESAVRTKWSVPKGAISRQCERTI